MHKVIPIAVLCLATLCLAAEPKILVEDKLADKPGDGWSWIKQNDKAWRSQDKSLQFRVLAGQENVLARTLPEPSASAPYAVEVTVTSDPQPTKQYEQVGLFFYADGKQGPKFVKEMIDGKIYMFPGKKEMTAATVQMRIIVDGKKFTAQYRPDAKGEYQTAFGGNTPAAKKGGLLLALACHGGPADAEHWVKFSNFRIVSLPPQEPDLTTKFAESDPDFKIQGEYEGEVKNKGKHGAQVVAKGDGKFEVYILGGGLPGAGWDKKTRTKLNATTNDKMVSFKGDWTGIIASGALTGKAGDDEFTLKRVERKSPTLGAKPPEGATVLFDGKNIDDWNNGRIVAGELLYRGTSSKKGFATGKLHLEFRTPYEPKRGGQGRGNSGMYILGREIQVLDSFGLEGKKDECGAFYGNKVPDVNMCLPPLVWQTYDVEINSDDKGNLVATVQHNGVTIHDKYPIGKKGAKPASINLQDHGNPVVYRNIWISGQ